MFRLFLRITGIILMFAFLTLVTQVGGIIYLLSLLIFWLVRTRVSSRLWRIALLPVLFLVMYALALVVVVPMIAKQYGRVPLPWSGPLKPETIFTCIMNRHYAHPDLKRLAMESTAKMEQAFPGTKVKYLDANFPFYNGFPLFPHLSHNDGRKLDIGLFYMDTSGNQLDDTPSPIGYGVFVDPRPGDEDYLRICEGKGFWQYGAMAKIISQDEKKNYRLDSKRQKAFIDILTADKRLQILLIEPHLKARMKLTSSKIRFHGCHAVRHDDHIHIQVRP